MTACPRCKGKVLSHYGVATCVNCGYEPSELIGMVGSGHQHCIACLEIMPESRYTRCGKCRPQSRHLKQKVTPSAAA